MQAIYKMKLDFGRQGNVEGVFITSDKRIKELIESGDEAYFGEILGKHSEITCSFDKDDFTRVTDNSEFVKLFKEYDLSSGYNPFDYLENDYTEDEES